MLARFIFFISGFKCLTFLCFFQGGSFGTLFIFDRDLTPIYPIDQSHNKYVGTLLNSDPWVKETFAIKGTFSEKKAALGGIRMTVHDYRKLIQRVKKNLFEWTL